MLGTVKEDTEALDGLRVCVDWLALREWVNDVERECESGEPALAGLDPPGALSFSMLGVLMMRCAGRVGCFFSSFVLLRLSQQQGNTM